MERMKILDKRSKTKWKDGFREKEEDEESFLQSLQGSTRTQIHRNI